MGNLLDFLVDSYNCDYDLGIFRHSHLGIFRQICGRICQQLRVVVDIDVNKYQSC